MTQSRVSFRRVSCNLKMIRKDEIENLGKEVRGREKEGKEIEGG